MVYGRNQLSKDSLCIGLLIPMLVLLLTPRCAYGDETDDFANAKNAFEAGEYEAAITRFNALLQSGLQNPALLLETHKILGICYLFTGNREAAEDQFTKLLTLSPDYSLDPLLYPIEVVDFFTEIKQASEKRLEELARVQALEAKKRQEEEERRRLAEIEKLKRNVYVERSRIRHSRLVAAIPFGAGQFQNGHKLKGALFLSFELVLTGSTIVTYFLHAGLQTKPFDDPNKRKAAETREKAYRIANYASLGVLGGVIIAGLIDSFYFFRPETVTWKSVEENQVPKKLRPGASAKEKKVSLLLGPGQGGMVLGVLGSF